MKVAYSNRGSTGTGQVRVIGNARFFRNGQISTGTAAIINVILNSGEVQVLIPS